MVVFFVPVIIHNIIVQNAIQDAVINAIEHANIVVIKFVVAMMNAENMDGVTYSDLYFIFI